MTPRQDPLSCALRYDDKAHTGPGRKRLALFHRFKSYPKVQLFPLAKIDGRDPQKESGCLCAVRRPRSISDGPVAIRLCQRTKPNLKGVGLDVSPAVRDYLGLKETDVADLKEM
jgi:hypothetical protein